MHKEIWMKGYNVIREYIGNSGYRYNFIERHPGMKT